MKIVVCIKQVPDSAARISVGANGQVTWGDAPLVINPWDEYAIEMALRQGEALGLDVAAISVGGESARDALKTALAMGCREAYLVSDPALTGADSQMMAKVLAGAFDKLGEVGLAFFGRQAIDGDMGVTAAQAARTQGWPCLSAVAALQVSGGIIHAERVMEEGRVKVESQTPAVISVSKDIGEPRYPSFMGIRKAQKAVIPVWSLADLGISLPARVVTWPQVSEPPARQVTTEIISGASPREIAEQLADKILAEKVLK